MSKVKSFRFSDVDIKRIKEIEKTCGCNISDLIKDYIEDSYFRISGLEKRQRVYFVHDYDADLYSDFYINKVDALRDLKNDITYGWSLDAVIECCYGPDVYIK